MGLSKVMAAAAVFALVGVGPVNAQQSRDRFNATVRGRDYVRSLVGPSAWLGVGAATALDQVRDDPPQWNIGDRALSNWGRLGVQQTIHHGLAAVIDRSTWYYRCSCNGAGARIGHAFAETITDHDRSGATHFSIANVAGAYGGAWAETTWRPDRSSGEVLANGTATLLASGVLNLWREFVH